MPYKILSTNPCSSIMNNKQVAFLHLDYLVGSLMASSTLFFPNKMLVAIVSECCYKLPLVVGTVYCLSDSCCKVFNKNL